MSGFWFTVIGLLFGYICSRNAKKKNRTQHDWFILGFLFSVFAYVGINLLGKIEAINDKDTNRTEPDYENAFIAT